MAEAIRTVTDKRMDNNKDRIEIYLTLGSELVHLALALESETNEKEVKADEVEVKDSYL